MSSDVKISLGRLMLVLGVLTALCGLIGYAGPLLGLPARMGALDLRVTNTEKEIRQLRDERAADREVWARIDENVKALKEAQARR